VRIRSKNARRVVWKFREARYAISVTASSPKCSLWKRRQPCDRWRSTNQRDPSLLARQYDVPHSSYGRRYYPGIWSPLPKTAYPENDLPINRPSTCAKHCTWRRQHGIASLPSQNASVTSKSILPPALQDDPVDNLLCSTLRGDPDDERPLSELRDLK